METKKTHWKTILELIANGENLYNIEIEFDNDTIPWQEAMILGKQGFKITQNLSI